MSSLLETVYCDEGYGVLLSVKELFFCRNWGLPGRQKNSSIRPSAVQNLVCLGILGIHKTSTSENAHTKQAC